NLVYYARLLKAHPQTFAAGKAVCCEMPANLEGPTRGWALIIGGGRGHRGRGTPDEPATTLESGGEPGPGPAARPGRRLPEVGPQDHSSKGLLMALNVGSLRCRSLSGVRGRPDVSRTWRKRRS